MTRERDLKVRQVGRSLGSLIAMAVCGYLSLGTSCDSSAIEETASIVLHFQPGQASAVLMVHTEGSGELRLHFDGEFIILRDGVPIGPPIEEGESRMDTVCEINPGTEPYEPRLPPGTHCTADEGPTSPMLYEVARQDTTEALDVVATGTLVGSTDCGGAPPERFGIVLEAEANL